LKDIKEIFNLGMTAPEVVVKIIEVNPRISEVLFKIFSPPKNLSEELVPWIRTSLYRMVFHQPPGAEDMLCLKREEITLQNLSRVVKKLAGEKVIAITSDLKLFDTDERFHIPMMDFDCEISCENLEKIQTFLKISDKKGVILQSGRSYHYYGIELIPEREWLMFLGRCLLFMDYTDSRYIGHRIIDGYGSLRISENKRRPIPPKVVAIV